MKTTILTRVITLSLLSVTPVQAEIYKWVDENGEVNFSEQKPHGNVATESVVPKIGPGSPEASTQSTPETSEEPAQPEATPPEPSAEDVALMKRNCEQAKLRAKSLARPRVNKVDEDGTRSRMPEEWRQAEILKAADAIREFCK